MDSRRNFYPALTMALALAAVAGCDTTPVPEDTTGPTLDGAAVRSQVLARSLDQEFMDIAREVPSFGGMYLDSKQRPVVYLTDLRDAARSTPKVSALVSSKKGLRAAPQARFVRGEYGFKDLKEWEERATLLLADDKVVFTDVDETKNRVRIGVRSSQDAPSVRAALAARGIPAAAVNIEVAEVPHFAYSLNDIVRPTLGGLRIVALHTSKICTLGFNARNALGTASIVVNSHCTDTQGGNESTRFFSPYVSKQPVIAEIGTESLDPSYFTGGICPSGRRCRYSDAALATARTSWSFEVARTTVEGTTSPGSIVVGQRLPVVADLTGSLAGMVVHKTGAFSGSTTGTVAGTCMKYDVGGTNVTLFCQYAVTAAGRSGDSGSPVYTWSGVAGSGASLAGLMWGITSTQFFFSSLDNIKGELGPLTTH